MGAVYTLVLVAILVVLGAIFTLINIGFAIIFGVLTSYDKKFAKVPLIISATFLRTGLFVAMIPVVFFCVILVKAHLTPSDFVETDTPIIYSHSDRDHFVADGVAYTALNDLYENYGLSKSYNTIKDKMTPVFHYMPDVAMGRYQSFNCYSIPNDSGYEIIYAKNQYYVKAGTENEVIDYYINESGVDYYHYHGYYNISDDYIEDVHRLPEDAIKAVSKLCSLDPDSLETVVFEFKERPEDLDILQVSADGVFLYEWIELHYINGHVYEFKYNDHPDGYTDMPEDERYMVYTFGVLPPEIDSVLSDYYENECPAAAGIKNITRR